MMVAAKEAGQAIDQPPFDPDLKLRHTLSCDSDQRVQTWILRTHDPQIFTKELKECSDDVILCEKRKEFVTTPNSKGCICSWVCHDVSLVSTSCQFELGRSIRLCS